MYIVRICAQPDGFSGCYQSQFVNVLAHGSAKHDGLHLLIAVFDYFLYLRLKTQLQQFVSLIKDQHLQILYAHASGVHQHIYNSAGSANHHFRVISQRQLLLLN